MASNIQIIKNDDDINVADQKYFLKKPVGAIYITNNGLTTLSRRVFNTLLKNAQANILEAESHEMDIEAFRVGINSESNNTHLKEVFKRIMGTVVEFNYTNRDKKRVWQASTLISDVKIIDNKKVIYYFPTTLRPYLADPEIYALIDSRVQNRFTSVYATILYEWVEDWYRKDLKRGITPDFEIAQFKEMMGVSKIKSYKLFANLRRNVIEPAIDEINDLTDFVVECKLRKKGRSYTHIGFIINKITEIEEPEKTPPTPLPATTKAKVLPPEIRKLIPDNQHQNCIQICLEVLNIHGPQGVEYYLVRVAKGDYTSGQPAKHWGKVLRGSKKNPGPVMRDEYSAYLKKQAKQSAAADKKVEKEREDERQRQLEAKAQKLRIHLVENLNEEWIERLDQYIKADETMSDSNLTFFKKNPLSFRRNCVLNFIENECFKLLNTHFKAFTDFMYKFISANLRADYVSWVKEYSQLQNPSKKDVRPMYVFQNNFLAWIEKEKIESTDLFGEPVTESSAAEGERLILEALEVKFGSREAAEKYWANLGKNLK